MYLLVVDDEDRFTEQVRHKVNWKQRDGELPEELEVLEATTFEQADAYIGEHGDKIVIVATDTLLHNKPATRMPDPERCGPAVYWRAKKFTSAHVVFLVNMGQVEDVIRRYTHMDALPPQEEGGWEIVDSFSDDYFDGDWIARVLQERT